MTEILDTDDYDFLAEDEKRRKSYEESGLFERLDALVELLEAARDAVTAWPMPQTYETPK